MLGPSIEEISQLLNQRREARGGMYEKMRAVRDTYKGEVIIPMPEMDKNEKPAIANLITQGLDQTAMRIASTMPNIFYPPVREGVEVSERKARTRTMANQGWWQVNNMPLVMRKRARYLIGYSSAPVILRPDTKWGCAKWEMRSPLDTFAPLNDDPLNMTPDDVIFTFVRSRAWLRKNYPEAEANLKADKPKDGDAITIAEYNDGECFVMMAISDAKDGQYSAPLQGQPFMELSRIPNRAGMCMTVIPTRISLDKPMGQFDSLLGMFELQAKLTALHVIAVERNIFPDTYLVSRPGELAKFVHGPVDGRTGEVNVVTGGMIDVKAPVPNLATDQAIDRLERAQRIASGTPADMTGESQSNVRTGKRGDAIMSSTIDFAIQENQDILAYGLQEENKRAIAIAKKYFGNERKSFYITSSSKNVDYIPNDTFENDNNLVTYSSSGSDINSLIVAIGQRIGMGSMSKQTAQELDPLIANPEREHDRVTSESINAMILATLQVQAQSGEIPPIDLAKIAMYVKEDKLELPQAMEKVHNEAQARQAALVQPGVPAAQPGLGAPGMGAEQPTISPPNTSTQNLADLLGSLRKPAGVRP